MKKTQDDLITPTQQEPIIIQQNSGNDKKFIYTLLILLVVLFIIALGIIIFLSSKFFNMQTPKENQTIQQNVPAKTIKQNEKAAVEKVVQQISKKQDTNAKVLEEIVEQKPKNKQTPQATQTQQVIAKTAQAAGKTLSPQDIQKIAALVAAQLAKMQNQQTKKELSSQATTNNMNANAEDQNLVASLQQASVDTLNEQTFSANSIKSDVKAKQSHPKKKTDTFNKVIIDKPANSDDEFSKLSKEIDSILQSTQSETQNNNTIETLKEEAKGHEKEVRFIVVKPGDTLSSIAYRAYGRASAYIKIYKANPHLIKDPNKIYVGMKIRVPVDDEYKGQ